ncbi:MAG: ABC transporter substrate-binding protein [Bacillota bacterium]|nr:ABC transporter substrate-binding protein [Bacillota bacterium]
MKHYSTICLFIVSLAFFTLCGCAGSSEITENDAGKEDELITVRLPGGDWGFPTPFAHYARGPGVSHMRYIFDSLLEKNEEGLIPWLAEDYEILEGGTRCLFHLRPDVYWHDGTALTADDVTFSFNYYREHLPVWIDDPLILSNEYLLSIGKNGEWTVEFILASPNATFLEKAGRLPIIPAHIWSGIERPDEFNEPEALTGSGPYILTDYSKEHGTYRYTANQKYWGPQPRIDILEFIPVGDEVLALENGDIHFARVPADLLERFTDNPLYEIMEQPAFWGYRLRFNMVGLPEFRQKELRQAFALAINRNELVEKIARGQGIPGSMGMLSPHHRWFNPNLPAYEYDPEKATEILSSLETPARESYELLVGEDAEVRIGELLKEQLVRTGLNLTIAPADLKTRDSRIIEGNYDLALVGHGAWGTDPDYLRQRYSEETKDWLNGTPGYNNSAFSKLAEKQVREMDEEKRREIIMEMQEILAEDVPDIPLYLRATVNVYRRDIYDGWIHIYDHHEPTHNKLSYLER